MGGERREGGEREEGEEEGGKGRGEIEIHVTWPLWGQTGGSSPERKTLCSKSESRMLIFFFFSCSNIGL